MEMENDRTVQTKHSMIHFWLSTVRHNLPSFELQIEQGSEQFTQYNMRMRMLRQIHGSVPNQIVKSLSLCYKKSYFLNRIQPINLISCKMIETVEQKILNRTDYLSRS